MNHIFTPVEVRKVDDPSQMCGDFDRLTPQLEVKVSGLVTECIECFLNLMSSHSTSQLQCCKAMFRQAETLVAVIASSVAGHRIPICKDSNVRFICPHEHRRACQLRRNRVAIAIELNHGVRIHDS